MVEDQALCFGPYRLVVSRAQLWRGNQVVRLTAKALAVLRHLVERPGQLVTKDELFTAVCAVVGEPALTVCVGRLRRALRENARGAQYIETVHRRGYRFIGKVARRPLVMARKQTAATRPPHPVTAHGQATTGLVGRANELMQLHRWLDAAIEGARQIVFVTGEAGIGKTTLVEAFLEQLRGRTDLWIARGAVY